MGGVFIVDASYALAALAGLGYFAKADAGRLRLFGWTCLIYGIITTLPVGHPSNGALGYAAGGFILTGAILIACYVPEDAVKLLKSCSLLLVILSACVILDGIGLLKGPSTGEFHFGQASRAGGLDFDPISAGEDGAMLLGLCFCFIRNPHKSWRLTAWFSIPIAVVATFMTISRAPVLGLESVVLCALGFALWKGNRVLLAASLSAIVISGAMLFFQSATLGRFIYSFNGDRSTTVRLTSWAATPAALLSHPFGGVQTDPTVLAGMDNNSALGLFGQLGLVGGLPLLALFLILLWKGGRNALTALREDLGWPLGAPVLAAIAWFVSEQFFGPIPDIVHSPFLWCLFGLLWMSRNRSM